MKVEEFIRARIEDGRFANENIKLLDAIEIVVDCHSNWPVLVSQPPNFERVRSFFDRDDVVFQLSQRMEWLTQEEFRRKFGTEPATAPIIKKIADLWSYHIDWQEEWD